MTDLEVSPRLDFRQAVSAMQDAMIQAGGHVENCPVRHIFAPGAYAREMTIPAGTIIIGKIHKHAHLNFITKGRAKVATEFGTIEIEAPHTFVSEPGTKRVVHALEDVVWTTVHVTDETDLAKIEDYVIAKDYEELERYLASDANPVLTEIAA